MDAALADGALASDGCIGTAGAPGTSETTPDLPGKRMAA